MRIKLRNSKLIGIITRIRVDLETYENGPIFEKHLKTLHNKTNIRPKNNIICRVLWENFENEYWYSSDNLMILDEQINGCKSIW